MTNLPIHFFTIVLNGMPFIRWCLHEFRKLPSSIHWQWHIVEGPALLVKDTAWAKENGGMVPWENLKSGTSTDGTHEYLCRLDRREVTLDIPSHRHPAAWEGKLEMVNRALSHVQEECLLWEVDSDELWTADQIVKMHDLFMAHPEKTAAIYRCVYFVGPNLIVTSLETYGNHDGEWRRTWRFKPGDSWQRHEPPVLVRDGKDIVEINPFGYSDTAGVQFQHFAYATRSQLEFKEKYYGYKGAVGCWDKLQAHQNFPAKLREFFPWVKDDAVVDLASSHGIQPLMACT